MTVRPLSEYAAVLADLDGTLIDSGGPVRRAWGGFAARHGLDVDTVLHAAQGRPARETALEFAPGAGDEPRRLELAELSDTDGVAALPGAAALLAAPLPLAIVTSCTRRLAAVRLAAAGLPVPDTLVTADDVARGKPDPEGYLTGARRWGAEPAASVVLEDAPAGVAAGKAAGMTVIAFTTTYPADALRAAGADAVLAGPDALEL